MLVKKTKLQNFPSGRFSSRNAASYLFLIKNDLRVHTQRNSKHRKTKCIYFTVPGAMPKLGVIKNVSIKCTIISIKIIKMCPIATEDTNDDCISCTSTQYTVEHCAQIGNALTTRGVKDIYSVKYYQQCLDKCTERARCTAIIYVHVQGRCFLKSTFSPATNSKHRITCIKSDRMIFSQKCGHSKCSSACDEGFKHVAGTCIGTVISDNLSLI